MRYSNRETSTMPYVKRVLETAADYCETGEFEHGSVPRDQRIETWLRDLAEIVPVNMTFTEFRAVVLSSEARMR